MAEFLQILVSGLSSGSIYALAAVGFTLLWQASQTINFAQGEFVMLPAVLILLAVKLFGLPLWAGGLLGIAVFLLIFGAGFKLIVVDPMIKHGVLPLAIATGAGANARHSIGTGIIGGMIGETTLAMLFVPLFFYIFDGLAERSSKKKKKEPPTGKEPDGAGGEEKTPGKEN